MSDALCFCWCGVRTQAPCRPYVVAFYHAVELQVLFLSLSLSLAITVSGLFFTSKTFEEFGGYLAIAAYEAGMYEFGMRRDGVEDVFSWENVFFGFSLSEARTCVFWGFGQWEYGIGVEEDGVDEVSDLAWY